MKTTFLFGAVALLMAVSCSSSPEPSQNVYPVEFYRTKANHFVEATMIHHGSIAFSYEGYNIQIDPVAGHAGAEIDYTVFPKADLILVSHEHGDHLDPEAIELLSKDGTRILANARSAESLGYGEVAVNGDEFVINEHIKLTVVPAYNTTEGRERFHPKGNGNGFILDFDGFKIYVSGDTEDIPEYQNFPEDIAVAFLSANQPYTMTAKQCVNAAVTIKPEKLIPYHVSDTDVAEIKTVAEALGIKVSLYEELK